MQRGILSVFAGFFVIIGAGLRLWADTPAAPPDFKEVYDLIRAHAAGVNEPQIDRAAVHALVKALAPKVALVSKNAETNSDGTSPLGKITVFEGGIGYIRITRVENGLPEAVRKSCQGLLSSNKLQGIVLDLRFTPGRDFDAAAGVADLFTSKEKPLFDFGNGMVKSKEKSDALAIPVAALVNHLTSGAAEALAAALREAGAGLVLGNRTAGEAMISEEFPLKNGERLRIATAPIKLGGGDKLSAEGVNPDISVRVALDDERQYLIDPFKGSTNSLFASSAGLSLTNNQTAASGNRGRRSRFNEADLVRERREGPSLDTDVSRPRDSEPEKPTVRDPVLARALDVLKGLAVIRQSRA